MKITVLGGDGFCGWPASLHLSKLGHEVTIIDNFSRRMISQELGADSLTPIASMVERIKAWQEVTGRQIRCVTMDVAGQYDQLVQYLQNEQPDVVIHFAEQRSAPYSMRTPVAKRYTIDNNVNATHNLLCAIVETGLDIHVVHLGTMGVYGYGTAGMKIPEGYLGIKVDSDGEQVETEILYPTNPGSVYHLTKVLDQNLFAYYAKNDKLRITDLHQGIIWGTNTAETNLDPRLVNRFDYDGDYGTVLNRFLVQAAVGYPLTVHGTGGQTRAFIHIQDMVRCIELAVNNPPAAGERVKIFNQMTETHRVRDLAELVAKLTGAQIANVDNPRQEDAENELRVHNEQFLGLGLDPITLDEGLLVEINETAVKFKDRVDFAKIPACSTWTKNQKPGIPDSMKAN